MFDGGRESASKVAARIERAVADKLNVSARITVLTGAEFKTVVEENPVGAVADNPSRLLVAFLSDPKDRVRLLPLMLRAWKPEVLGDASTTRNWATVTRIRALL